MNLFSSHHSRKKKGFTLIELMVSVTVLTILILISSRIYLNYLSTSRNLSSANLVYEEGRFLMEKIVREVRQNAIDYEQYFNQNINIPMGFSNSYVDSYCSYSSFFYDSGESRGVRNATREAVILGSLPVPDSSAVRSFEDELYLINMSGNKRTILARVEKDLYGDGKTIGKIAMLKMVGKDFGNDHINGRESYNNGSNHADCKPDDGEGDGLIDSWHCDPDFPCKTDVDIVNNSQSLCEGYAHLAVKDVNDSDYSFVDISPNALNVIGLRFFISPKDDPWKAYNMNEVQIQPHITIQLTVAANPRLVPLTNVDAIPTLTLTSTITSRNYDEIKSDC